MFDEQLVTVWSAPNYCYRCGNLASIMTVHEDGTRAFTVYDAAPENARDKAQGKRLVCAIAESLRNAYSSIGPHAVFCLTVDNHLFIHFIPYFIFSCANSSLKHIVLIHELSRLVRSRSCRSRINIHRSTGYCMYESCAPGCTLSLYP